MSGPRREEHGMKGKTVHEIEAEYSRELTELQRDYYEAIDDVRAMRVPEGVPHLDKMSPQGYGEILADQKTAAKDAARERAISRYREATGERREAIEARKRALDARLYRVGGEGSEAGALVVGCARATDEELRDYLERAERTGAKDLARAVFVEADARGLSTLVDAYFERVDPEGRELYAEYQAMPTPEQIETAAGQAETFVHDTDPEMLRSGPRVA